MSLLNDYLVKAKSSQPKEHPELAITLASELLSQAKQSETKAETQQFDRLSEIAKNPGARVWMSAFADQVFRGRNNLRTASQLRKLIAQLGIPGFLSLIERLQLHLFYRTPLSIAHHFIPLVRAKIRSDLGHVVLPDSGPKLTHHLRVRAKQGLRLNLNYLGETVLSKADSDRQMKRYLAAMENPAITAISVKLSSIYHHISVLAFDHTVTHCTTRLATLYRKGMQQGVAVSLDMESYQELRLTVETFKKTLSNPEFLSYTACIALQAYVPDSYWILQDLIAFSTKRVKSGGAPIKIRLVKGANLSMERIVASQSGWPLATFETKVETDANYKRMLLTLCHAPVGTIRIGLASHNVLDIAFALVLRSARNLESVMQLEMLEGMANPLARLLQKIAGPVILYCPLSGNDYTSSLAYLVRRLEENMAPDHFVSVFFDRSLDKPKYDKLVTQFRHAIAIVHQLPPKSHRTQDRTQPATLASKHGIFIHEADTDWSIRANRQWISEILNTPSLRAISLTHSALRAPLSRRGMGNTSDIQTALVQAETSQPNWKNVLAYDKIQLLKKVALEIQKNRGELIALMVRETKKTIEQADPEVSEAIDFIHYYCEQLDILLSQPGLKFSPKGPTLIASPWNFPFSIPTGCIAAALLTGNTVIFKPAPESTQVGWCLVNLFWKAGIPKEVLHYVSCDENTDGVHLIQDPRLKLIMLTGATQTAQYFQRLRPDVSLVAETGGKNTTIVSAMADRELAIQSILTSAFGHSGQKCSAASLLICEAEVYDDPQFMNSLKQAAKSLKVGAADSLDTEVSPLIRLADGPLLRAIHYTEKKEPWLLKPEQDSKDPTLWSPGIKLGIKEGGFFHQTELFGPVLGVMRAKNLAEALRLANTTPYALTAGFYSLDKQEIAYWLLHIHAGNRYVNRPITGAIVGRQPFGGYKASAFGNGFKAGGENYLLGLINVAETKQDDYSLEKWAGEFRQPKTPYSVLGEENTVYCTPVSVGLRITEEVAITQIQLVIDACTACGSSLKISAHPRLAGTQYPMKLKIESDQSFEERVQKREFDHIRLFSPPSARLINTASQNAIRLITGPALTHGRVECLHYLQEVSVSHETHRYGALPSTTSVFV